MHMCAKLQSPVIPVQTPEPSLSKHLEMQSEHIRNLRAFSGAFFGTLGTLKAHCCYNLGSGSRWDCLNGPFQWGQKSQWCRAKLPMWLHPEFDLSSPKTSKAIWYYWHIKLSRCPWYVMHQTSVDCISLQGCLLSHFYLAGDKYFKRTTVLKWSHQNNW